MTPEPASEKRFRQQIVHGYFVRFHMAVILSAVVASGILTSKFLLECGIHSMRLRYPLAVFGSYLVFFLLVRVWIWYVCRVKMRAVELGNFDAEDIPLGGSSQPFKFGGGTSGGGGASDAWDDSAAANIAPRSAGSALGSKSGGFKFGGFDLDLGDDGMILVLLAVLVLSIVVAGGYLIYVAPSLLPEAAWQALLASSLTRVSQRIDHQDWLASVLRASSIPFAAVLVVAGALGWVAHSHCPPAVKLHEVLFCVAR